MRWLIRLLRKGSRADVFTATIQGINEDSSVRIKDDETGGEDVAATLHGYTPVLRERVLVAEVVPSGLVVLGAVYNLPE